MSGVVRVSTRGKVEREAREVKMKVEGDLEKWNLCFAKKVVLMNILNTRH